MKFGASLIEGVNDMLKVGDTSVLILFGEKLDDLVSWQRFDFRLIGREDLFSSAYQ